MPEELGGGVCGPALVTIFLNNFLTGLGGGVQDLGPQNVLLDILITVLKTIADLIHMIYLMRICFKLEMELC